jgi:hypothetical protein
MSVKGGSLTFRERIDGSHELEDTLMINASETLTGLFAALAVAVAATFPVAIYWAERRLGAAPAAARRAAAVAGVGTALWLGLTGVLGAAGALRFDTTPPTAMLAITAMWILAVALGVSRVGERLALGLPLAALVGVQGFRLPLELLMHRAYTEGVMPVQMSYSGWNFDIVTGISALAVAALLAAGRMPLWGVRVWNWMGLALLANIVTIAMFSTPTPLRVFTNEPANVWITHTPFVWLPMVMVMAAIVGHIVILRRLRAESARQADRITLTPSAASATASWSPATSQDEHAPM